MKNEVVIKELSTSELQEKLEAERQSYQKLLMSHAISPIENPAKIKESRRTIARYLTELHSRVATK